MAKEGQTIKENTVPCANIQSKRRLQIRSVDMEPDMQREAVRLANEAMDKFTIEMEIAQHIKTGMDATYPPPWHCIAGRKFGSYVTHETGYFIYHYLGHLAILLFKSRD